MCKLGTVNVSGSDISTIDYTYNQNGGDCWPIDGSGVDYIKFITFKFTNHSNIRLFNGAPLAGELIYSTNKPAGTYTFAYNINRRWVCEIAPPQDFTSQIIDVQNMTADVTLGWMSTGKAGVILNLNSSAMTYSAIQVSDC